MRLLMLAAALAAFSFPAFAQDDPHRWLEGIDDPDALAWVLEQNAASTAALQGDARYDKLHARALAILSAKGRIATPNFIGPSVFNFWQDERHVRGIWRRASLASYRRGDPKWETVLDIDALAAAEDANWVWKGATCRPRTHDRCVIELSDGGKDATEVREFDLKTKRFVEGGFHLPEAKQTVQWLDPDTLILNRDWGEGTLTESGYGFVVKAIKRGQPLDEAVEVYRGEPGDVSVYPVAYADAAVVVRATDFFNNEHYLVTPDGPVRLDVPTQSELEGMVDGRLIFRTQADWAPEGLVPVPSGSLVALPLNGGAVETVFAPGDRVAIDADEVEVSAGRVIAVIYDNVRGRLASFAPGETGWTRLDLPVPENAAVRISAVGDVDDKVFYTVEGFLSPKELTLADAATGKGKAVDEQTPAFKTRNLIVEQHEVTSKDGTVVPYFLVRRKDAPMDGSTPTLLYGYGGFQISRTPQYDPVLGALWLARGGAYAMANIRGGGEFGPAWHQAAMNDKRQNAYDDFIAVSEDLIARKITSPRRLGIYGRSNGGLLMGVAMTQRPDLYNAVVIESPLLDMLRYHQWPPGGSWIGEYGDPRIPEEAAWIAGYSPYQALKPGVAYPLAYITTNTRDDRVHPAHARRFAAKLADLEVPYLYYEDIEGGHANAADPKANARRWAMHYVYLMQRLMD